jgi:hypothetical protein
LTSTAATRHQHHPLPTAKIPNHYNPKETAEPIITRAATNENSPSPPHEESRDHTHTKRDTIPKLLQKLHAKTCRKKSLGIPQHNTNHLYRKHPTRKTGRKQRDGKKFVGTKQNNTKQRIKNKEQTFNPSVDCRPSFPTPGEQEQRPAESTQKKEAPHDAAKQNSVQEEPASASASSLTLKSHPPDLIQSHEAETKRRSNEPTSTHPAKY